MLLVRLGVDDKPSAERPLYGFRPTSLGLSVALHAAVIALLWFLPAVVPPVEISKRPIYDKYIKPEEKRIIWYPLHETLPQVTAVDVPKSPKATGEVPSRQAIVAKSPDTRNADQLIWRPLEKVKIEQAVKAPNLVALTGPATPPAPSPPPAPKPKTFQAPKEAPKTPLPQETIPVLTAPGVTITPPGADDPMKKLARNRGFVPPPPKVVKRPENTPALLNPIPEVQFSAASTDPLSRVVAVNRTAGPPPAGSPNGGAAPSGSANGVQGGNGASGQTQGGTGAQINAAMVGVQPSDRLSGPIPEGSRSARFSAGPNPGPPSTSGNGTGVSIPNLSVDSGSNTSGRTGSAGATDANAKAVTYSESIVGPLPSTLSAPLHPSARTIPRFIEARFQGRTVYVLVIPAPRLPQYSGDWTLWFGEREGGSGAVQMRAPLPYRKIEKADAPPPNAAEKLVRVPILITKDGLVRAIEGHPGVFEERVIRDLMRWSFRPATRNGSPVEVEAVIELSYRDRPE